MLDAHRCPWSGRNREGELGFSRFPLRGTALLLGAAIAPAFAQQPKPAPPPAAQEFIHAGEATSILGRQVIGPDNQVIGRIVDVLVGDIGEPRAAIVDVGGFLGLGTRRIAIAWRALHFVPVPGKPGKITLDMTIDQIRATPQYRPAGNAVTVAAPP
jgi:hypothetical protein